MATRDQPLAASLLQRLRGHGSGVRSEDLGIGAGFSSERYLNRNGTFNLRKRGLPVLRQLHVYHTVITMTWGQFLLLCVSTYLTLCALFAFAFFVCGADAISGSVATTTGGRLRDAFFLSVQTFSTIGYGGISPGNIPANIVATIEAMAGLITTALATGTVFARFARPRAKITFSRNAVMAPFQGGHALMVRVANLSRSLLTQVDGSVVMVLTDPDPEHPRRRILPLRLERDHIMFMPMHWVLVHPIDAESPLHGVDQEAFREMRAEFFVVLTGLDETYAQPVGARSSYVPDEVEWGARFRDIYLPREPGDPVEVDLGRIHDIEPAKLPETP